MGYEWKRGEDWPTQKTYKELGRSNFLQSGITASSQAHWMGPFSFGMLCGIICVNIVLSATYSPNGERWLSMWDVVDTTAPPKVTKLTTFEEQRSIMSITLLPSGKSSALGRQHLFIECAHWWTGQKDKTQVAMTSVHSQCGLTAGWVTSVFFSQDGKQILSIPRDNTARVWDPITAQPLSLPFRSHTHWVISVCLFPDGHNLLLGPAMEQKEYGHWSGF